MIDSLLLNGILAGIGISLLAGPLGCFIIWRRMAYFGDTVAHSSLLGVSLAILLDVNLIIGVFTIAVCIALLLTYLQRQQTLSSDSLLGILSHGSLAIGLVCLSFISPGQSHLMGYLFGEILAVSTTDIWIIYLCCIVGVICLVLIWKKLLAETTSYELAKAEGMQPEQARFIFMLLISGLIALTMKIVGILLITALLIIPAAAARRFASGPEQMAVIAIFFGALSVVFGIYGAFLLDTPASPTIVFVSLFCFLVSFVPFKSLK